MSLRHTLAHLGRTLSPFHYARGTVAPNDEHLTDRVRVFMAPDAAASQILRLLSKDEDFLKVIPRGHHEYLLTFAVCGEEIRANFYLVEEDPSLENLHDEQWRNNGKFRYLLNYDKTVTQIKRPLPGKYHHPLDARLSYTRVLSVAELALVDTLRIHTC